MSAFRATVTAALLTVFVLAPATARNAAACSCMENPPCAAAGWADAVVVGRVIGVEREVIRGGLGWRVHRVAVSQPLRGSPGAAVTLVPDVNVTSAELDRASTQTGETEILSTCDYAFEVGEQYVIYLRRRPDGRWTTSKCAGTTPLSEATADLDYFADLVAAAPDARIYGSVTRAVPDPSDSTGVGTTPEPGVSVAVSGAGVRLTVTSDDKGEFDIHVPPGDYTVAPVIASTVKAYNAPARISVRAYACAPVRFTLDPARLFER
jgi:hypothetical protein